MTIVEKYEQGVPCWVDLITTDESAAREFYGELFGWRFDAYPMGPDATYYMSTLHSKNVAGLMQQFPDDESAPFWNTYIAVDDADAAVERALAAGGTIDTPVGEIPGSGRAGAVVDPEGARISVWQALGHIGSAVVNEHGAVVWNELYVGDVQHVLPFYEQTFGLTTETATMGEAGDYTQFAVQGRHIAGARALAPHARPAWLVYFAVDDTDAIAARAADLGATIIEPPAEMPGVGRFALIADPQGAQFFVIHG